eukprot:TRINITY_DN107372_c0_g1_i1.p1 TRINITY_DN107372_c0_g1~~TRINITY_DN107372_c0_g1_i1.p1  ORF type:complete len:827 (+),score=85.49 TRINITY_DN107372_c0_g1_i1:75-2555(+)
MQNMSAQDVDDGKHGQSPEEGVMTTDESGAMPAGEQIPFLKRLVFCAPTAGMLPFVAMFSLYGNANYETFGATLPRISLFTALARSFDVVSDPLMSYLTDSTRTRFGRRIPFLVAGALPYSLFLFLLMRPPYGDESLMSNWFGCMYVLYFLSNTFVTIPYYALAPELSSDSDQRTRLFFTMSIFEAFATLLAMLGPMVSTMQVSAVKWNKWWVCKDFVHPTDGLAELCFRGRSCGNAFVDGVGSAFKLNETLHEMLAPLNSGNPVLPDNLRACSSWMSGAGGKVLAAMSTSLQNHNYCECVMTCNKACAVADKRTGFEWVGWLFAIWFVLSMTVLVCVVKERQVKDRAPSPPLVPAMFNTMFNGPFRVLLPAWACDAYCNAVVQSMTPYFVIIVTQPAFQKDCLDPGSSNYNPMICNASSVIGMCGASVLLACIAGLPVWNCLVRRVGKIKTWWLWSLSMALTNLAFVFLGRGAVPMLWIVAALNGLPIGAKFLADSILSDIIDYDEFLTGQRNEATYFMFKGFLPKIVQIPASAVPIALLGAVGYKSPIGGLEQQQDEPVQWYVRAVVLSCFLASLLSFFIKRRYPLSTLQHLEKIKAGIKAHQAGRDFPDPVTGVEYRLTQCSEHLRDLYILLDHFRDWRIRVAFVDRLARRSTNSEELQAAIDVTGGGYRLLQTMIFQLCLCAAIFVASVISSGFAMQLLTNNQWNFVPTFTFCSIGFSFVAGVIASCRLRAARQLKTLADNGELTAHVVTQVLLRRDLLGKVGVQSPTGASSIGKLHVERPRFSQASSADAHGLVQPPPANIVSLHANMPVLITPPHTKMQL